MRKSKLLLGVAAALVAMPLMGSQAWSAACVDGGTVASYIALGATGCTVGQFLFSNIHVTGTTDPLSGSSVTLNTFTVLNPAFDNEFGLALNYTATALSPGGSADVAWTYNVSGVDGTLIGDAFLALAANDTGSGQSSVSEILSNGFQLSLNGPGSTSITFPGVSSLFVMKDQANITGLAPGTATASILTNAFSPVPAPIVGAGLPGLVAACAGLIGLGRRRRREQMA
jgi:hypothetical protein